MEVRESSIGGAIHEKILFVCGFAHQKPSRGGGGEGGSERIQGYASDSTCKMINLPPDCRKKTRVEGKKYSAAK
jgi:hypothetical protein